MTTSDIRFINPPNVPELYSDYVIVAEEGENVALKFYRQRPMLNDKYEIDDTGNVVGLNEENQEFEGVLQASIVLPFHTAYYLLSSLEDSGVKALFWSRSRAALQQVQEDENARC